MDKNKARRTIKEYIDGIYDPQRSRLFRAVVREIKRNGEPGDILGVMDDIQKHGMESGIISGQIYYKDTNRFYLRHRDAINNMLAYMMDDIGTTNPGEVFKAWDDSDPLALDVYNRNTLSWFAFEEVVNELLRAVDDAQ